MKQPVYSSIDLSIKRAGSTGHSRLLNQSSRAKGWPAVSGTISASAEYAKPIANNNQFEPSITNRENQTQTKQLNRKRKSHETYIHRI
jgi:hypothetical protein